MGEQIAQSTLREDITNALRKEHERQNALLETHVPGSAPRANVASSIALLSEYIGLLDDENMNIVLKIEREYPENGRIRL